MLEKTGSTDSLNIVAMIFDAIGSDIDSFPYIYEYYFGLPQTGDPVFILKNNNMEAVLVSFNEYRHLVSLEEMFEYFEIDDIVQKRLNTYDRQANVRWENLRREV